MCEGGQYTRTVDNWVDYWLQDDSVDIKESPYDTLLAVCYCHFASNNDEFNERWTNAIKKL